MVTRRLMEGVATRYRHPRFVAGILSDVLFYRGSPSIRCLLVGNLAVEHPYLTIYSKYLKPELPLIVLLAQCYQCRSLRQHSVENFFLYPGGFRLENWSLVPVRQVEGCRGLESEREINSWECRRGWMRRSIVARRLALGSMPRAIGPARQ